MNLISRFGLSFGCLVGEMLEMKNVFYKLIVRGLIVIKYSGFAFHDLFWDYEVNEHADKFLIEVDDLISSNRISVRIKIHRQEVERSFLETASLFLETLEEALDWYIKEDKT